MAYRDKEDQKKCADKHYLENKEIYKDRAKKHTKLARKRNREFIDDYLGTHPCVDCGEKDIIVLEFDHVRGSKDKEVTIGLNHGWSIKRLESEIAKCEVRCANCHRRATHQRRKLQKI